jgi:hypothetical protein
MFVFGLLISAVNGVPAAPDNPLAFAVKGNSSATGRMSKRRLANPLPLTSALAMGG